MQQRCFRIDKNRTQNVIFTWGSLSNFPANWIISQPNERICISTSSDKPSFADGVVLNLSNGRTEFEISSRIWPYCGRIFDATWFESEGELFPSELEVTAASDSAAILTKSAMLDLRYPSAWCLVQDVQNVFADVYLMASKRFLCGFQLMKHW